jgi:transposase-like protein
LFGDAGRAIQHPPPPPPPPPPPQGDMAERLKALERENRELRQANEILRKASAYFAQAELDRPFKR